MGDDQKSQELPVWVILISFLFCQVVSEIPAQGRNDKICFVVMLFLGGKHIGAWGFGSSSTSSSIFESHRPIGVEYW